MGVIRVKLEGSFVGGGAPIENACRAMDYGHAAAVAKAIQYLSEIVLPEAIKLDHRLHDEGSRPAVAFGKE